ncbi:MAG TPA: Gfo/Idh/MocA family oxidoreductase [Thermomicrobiales bacterium]
MVVSDRVRGDTQRGGTVRIGIIGAGHAAAMHVPALSHVPDAEIVALCSRRPDRAHFVAARFGIRNVVHDYRDLLRDPEVDAVIIATPPHLHHSMVLAALEARKHILCEKPLARTLAEARDMEKMARTAGVVAMINHEYRYIPARARAKELIDEGYIGDPYSASVTVYRSSLNDPFGEPWDWLSEAGKGGGMLAAAGSHHIDSLRWWLGDVKSVAGATATMVKRRRLPESSQTAPVDADDNFVVLMRLVCGALATIHYSATATHDVGDEVILSGSEGVLVITGDGHLLGGRRREALAELPIPERLTPEFPPFEHPLTVPTIHLLREWVRAIRLGIPGEPSFADGVKVQEVIDGVLRSSQQGRWIEIARSRFQIA